MFKSREQKLKDQLNMAANTALKALRAGDTKTQMKYDRIVRHLMAQYNCK